MTVSSQEREKREEQQFVEHKIVSDGRTIFLIQASNLSGALQLKSIQGQRGIRSGASN